MNRLDALKAAGCRVNGVTFALDGSVVFRDIGGAWTEAQKSAALKALGMTAPVLTADQQKAHFAAVIQAWLDRTAQGSGYNNLAYGVSYAGSAVDLWARQGAAFVAWRDAVWQAAFGLLAQVEAGTAPMPTDAALIAELPQPNIPTS